MSQEPEKLSIEELRTLAGLSGEEMMEQRADLRDVLAARVLIQALDGDRASALTVGIALADAAIIEDERDTGQRWSSYLIYSLGDAILPDGRAVKAGTAIYAGRSRQVQEREKRHRQNAQLSSPPTAISLAIKHLQAQGVGVFVHQVASDLSLADAKMAEGSLIRELLKSGAPLQNSAVYDGGASGLGGLGANHHSVGTSEYADVQRVNTREYHRRQRATAAGRARRCASNALTRLKSGGLLTPRGVEVITLAGPDYITKAKIILEARNESWPTEATP